MATPLPPDAKKKILAAYQKFQVTLAKIAKDHHATVGRVMTEVDKTKADDIRKKIGLGG